MREAQSWLIPYSASEISWAHERPGQHRTPLPVAGDEVEYRHDSWGPVVRVDVVHVQSLDDIGDPHLWRVELDGFGRPLLLDDRPVMQQRFDPWPVLRLKVPRVGLVDTREARLRGSPGWLPLDWETRFRPMPEFTIITHEGGRTP